MQQNDALRHERFDKADYELLDSKFISVDKMKAIQDRHRAKWALEEDFKPVDIPKIPDIPEI